MRTRFLFQLKGLVGIFLFFLLVTSNAIAQEEKKEVDHSYKPLKLSLNEDGSKYIRFITWHQFWLTSNDLSEDNSKFQVTPSIRRSRFLAFAQVSPRFLILAHWGLNGLTPNNLTTLGNNGDAPQLFLHDAWGEFKLSDALYVGGGLHYWKGMTRLSNQSTLNFLTLDQPRPFAHWHSLGVTDQFARHLGVYFKGNLKKFDYRIALNAPARSVLGDGKNYGDVGSDWTYQGVSNADSNGDPKGTMVIEGYFRYNLWDAESIKLPYAVGSYLGGKKVLGIGAGFFLHPNGMYNTVTNEHGNVSHFALDVFMDLPTTNGSLTAYASFMNFNYQENYASRWAGTGSNFYIHAGYYIKSANLMPYVAFQTGSYDGFNDNPSSINVGLNYYVLGHNAKITLEYHGVNNHLDGGADGKNSQIRLQAHIFL